MIARSTRIKIVPRTVPQIVPSVVPRFQYSTKTSEPEVSPEELQKRREEAAKLAMQSIKDIGNMLSLTQSDKETSPIDTKAIYEDPKLFDTLSLFHQGQVLEELQEKFDKKWTLLTGPEKQLGYYISYGNWGVRENFDNWNQFNTPYDLPFETPSKIRTFSPKSNDKIVELPERDFRLTPVRKDQFNIKRLDSVTKVFIYITVIICLGALYRDKYIGEEGRPVEVIIRDIHEEERQKRLLQEAKEAEEAARRKWYYLWLK